ncbi:uncharacterized protein [Mytilus edulis]|uniref:uncharacterized protein n=1 Tax=Mytilus edulis TaxID=6550 RepID=UPI0039EF5F35
MIKQRGDEWFELRKGSRITGSTIFRGIGLGTLKEQQQHYDKAFHGKETPVSAELQELFDYGTSQEINALGTLVSKILPVYFPDLVYREDGCEVISIGDSYAVISGDGSGVDNNDKVQMAFEFKCPKPGKERTTDVHYQIPKYYSTQLLSQMAAKKCGKFCYISYTPESATVIEGVYDDEIWREIWDSINELYKNDDTRRPSRNKPEQKILLQRLIEYSKSCPFVAEFPSVKSIPCSCTSTNDKDHVFGSHNSEPAINLNPRMTLEDISSTLDAATSQLKDAYEILRRPSKEILLTVMSDIDRMSTRNETAHYAVPIQYALPGYSLTMDIVRKLLIKAVGECKSRDLRVKAVAFDGQFLELAVEDDKGRPLTVLRFMKFFWEKVQKIDRATKISTLLNLNKFPEITDDDSLKANFEVQKDIVVNGKIIITSKTDLKVLPSAINITEAIKKVHSKRNQDMSQNPLPNDVNQIDEQEDLDVLRYIPEDVLSEMNEEAIDSVRHAQKGRNQTREVVTENDTPPEQESMFPIETDFEMALVVLIASSTIANSKWNEVSLDEFKTCFSNAEAIRKSFTVNEMRTILSLTQNKNEYTKMLKPNLVNSICCIYGDGSKLPQPTSSPKCLKALVTNHILKWPILAVNVAYAQLTFPDEFMEWEASNCFNGKGTMRTDTGKTFCISKWYAQPTEINGQLLQPIIDPHHIFVNNRSRCCSKGLHDMGVYSEAWWKVAENYKTNGTGLSLEIAKELRDRQKNAFAHTTFSNKVQAEMEILGFNHEAEWCQLIRIWYSAIDEAGVPIDLRIDWLLAMRNKLLPFLKVGHFPPPGAYVASLPLAQFEGLMSNVDRRLQLYDMVQTGTYNQRAITSLDSETFFSGFQDYDPKGTGVLRPDDIPIALGSAVYLFSQRLNSDRKFYMKTSKKLRVYPEHKLDDPESFCDKRNETNDTNTDTHDIQVGSHFFDKMERKSSCLNRKKGIISEFGAPGRGAEGARLYHRTNEERILAHKRFGLKDDDLTDI